MFDIFVGYGIVPNLCPCAPILQLLRIASESRSEQETEAGLTTTVLFRIDSYKGRD